MIKIENKENLISLLKQKQLNMNFINEVLESKKFHKIITEKYLEKDKDWDLIKILYEEYNLPFYKIGMLFNITDNTAKAWGMKQGVINKGHCRGVNSNNSYFEKIDTPDKAYFLGLWFADGSIVHYKTCYSVSLTLTETDNYIIYTFLNYAKIQTPVWQTHKEDNHPRSQININSKKMFNDLNNLGCICDKSHKGIKIPYIEEDLKSHFIRGFFDGDGIAFSDGRLGFCGDKAMLIFIKETFDKFLENDKVSITFNSSNNIYYISFNKKEHVDLILDYMYNNKEDLFLKRKYEKYRPLE